MTFGIWERVGGIGITMDGKNKKWKSLGPYWNHLHHHHLLSVTSITCWVETDFTLCTLEQIFQKHCTYSLRWKSSKILKASIGLKTFLSLKKRKSTLIAHLPVLHTSPHSGGAPYSASQSWVHRKAVMLWTAWPYTPTHCPELELSWSSALALWWRWPSLLLLWWPLDHQQVLSVPQICLDVRDDALTRNCSPCLGSGLRGGSPTLAAPWHWPRGTGRLSCKLWTSTTCLNTNNSAFVGSWFLPNCCCCETKKFAM